MNRLAAIWAVIKFIRDHREELAKIKDAAIEVFTMGKEIWEEIRSIFEMMVETNEKPRMRGTKLMNELREYAGQEFEDTFNCG